MWDAKIRLTLGNDYTSDQGVEMYAVDETFDTKISDSLRCGNVIRCIVNLVDSLDLTWVLLQL